MRRLLGLGLLALVLCPAAIRAGEHLEHVVQPGESLSQSAAQAGGDPQRWPVLYRANRDQIKDPSRLYPGQALLIPEFPLGGSSVGGKRAGPAADTPRALR